MAVDGPCRLGGRAGKSSFTFGGSGVDRTRVADDSKSCRDFRGGGVGVLAAVLLPVIDGTVGDVIIARDVTDDAGADGAG